MSRLEKRIRRLYDAPKSISADDLAWILGALGFEDRGGKGSHRGFKHPELGKTITIPNQNPLKVAYVVQARKLIEEVLEYIEDE
ncbi:MAG: type II toxin-antitoxin system HicA family toxin [Anaerolineales bacterium]